MTADESGHLWSEVLDLYIGVADGQLRYFHPDKSLVPTPAEASNLAMARNEVLAAEAEEEKARAKAERKKATQAEAKVAKLVEQLKTLGVEADI